MRTLSFLSGFSLGVSIFLLGLKLLGSTLESALGKKIQPLLTRLTTTKFKSLLAGMFATFLVQSSSAIASTMVVLVSSGILPYQRAFGVILGANIGTTLTAQIMVFRIENVALPLILAGLLICLKREAKTWGTALFALGSLFYGLTITTSALTPLLQLPRVVRLLAGLAETPLLACGLGVVLTALVQSSSALTGLVVRLASLGTISLSTAVAMALGSNIGTVVTTLLASVGRGRESRATAYADFIFNLGGVILILPWYGPFLKLIMATSRDLPRQIAHAHTVFNVFTALLALPFLEYLAGLAWRWAGIGAGSEKYKK